MSHSEIVVLGQRSAVSRGEFSSGWPVLVTAVMGCGLGASSLPFYSFGAFILPLGIEFGWSRGQVSAALIYMTVTLALTSYLLGSAIDRLGVRAVALFAIPLLAAVLFALHWSNGSLIEFYAMFSAISLLGGGTTPINYTKAINQQFTRRRGLALGLTLSGMGMSAVVIPPLATYLLSRYGWRVGYQALALLALCALPAVWFGLPRAGPAVTRPEKAARNLAFLRSRVFWTIALTCFGLSIALSGLLVHLLPLLRDSGMSPAIAARYASMIGLGSIIGRLASGALIDRLFAPHVAGVTFMATAIGCAVLAGWGVGSPAITAAAALLIGFSFGSEVDLVAYFVVRYFGVKHYGLVYSTTYSCFAIGAACGPTIAGMVFDTTGSYGRALWGAVVILVIGAAAMLTLPEYPADAVGEQSTREG